MKPERLRERPSSRQRGPGLQPPRADRLGDRQHQLLRQRLMRRPIEREVQLPRAHGPRLAHGFSRNWTYFRVQFRTRVRAMNRALLLLLTLAACGPDESNAVVNIG